MKSCFEGRSSKIKNVSCRAGEKNKKIKQNVLFSSFPSNKRHLAHETSAVNTQCIVVDGGGSGSTHKDGVNWFMLFEKAELCQFTICAHAKSTPSDVSIVLFTLPFVTIMSLIFIITSPAASFALSVFLS